MVTPRRSARVAASDSSPVYTDPPESGRVVKRKSTTSGNSPSAKRGKKSSQDGEKKQTTIDDTMDLDQEEDSKPSKNGDTTSAETVDKSVDQEDSKDNQESSKDETVAASKDEKLSTQEEHKPTEETEKLIAEAEKPEDQTKPADAQPALPESGKQQSENQQEPAVTQEPSAEVSKPAEQSDKPDTTNVQKTSEEEPKADAQPATNGNAVQSHARDDDVPSSILEKGIIYFFFRPRVNIEDPQDINDIARSYMILRPIPLGAKLGDGPIGDDNNCRLIALPKKVLPQSGKDRFMVFVESAKTNFKDLKENFLTASDYATKTVGTSHSPPATPLAEGVYAITTTGRDSHLAYMTTIPNEIGEVQKDVGIKSQGSFLISAKNPDQPGPANASLGKDPGFSKEIMDEFRGRRWMPLEPKLLEYENCQFLIIGESSGLESATEQLPRDEKKDTETPMEEMEKLEGEDEIRVKHLKGDDAVFTDLGVSKKDYPAVPSTW